MTMTSLQRVLTTLGHQEPDRVPLLLTVNLHGAKELGLGIKEYYSRPENVVEGQLRLRARYQQDNVMGFYYASIEVEAWGGEVVFYPDGPPNSGEPFIKKSDQIRFLEPPSISASPCLCRVLKTIEMLKNRVKDEVPILGVAISPFSLPVMQIGFDRYFEVMYKMPDLFEDLIHVNEEFCVNWANAQLQAGATAIVYFDPISSPTIIPRELYLKTGHPIAKRTIARIMGPTATHFASGRCLSILDDVAATGTLIAGVSVEEDLAELKAASRGKLTVAGNMNGIEMRTWTPEKAEQVVKECIAKAGKGGGYILSDNHGEIPWQVSDETMLAISAAVRKWGNYPLDWIDEHVQ